MTDQFPKIIFRMKTKLIISIILFVFCSIAVLAGDNPKKSRGKFEASLSINSFYDSNILKYSDKYIERFKNYQDEGRFHINRYDDLVFTYDFEISYSDKLISDLRTVLGAEFDTDMYSYNHIKNWSNYSLYLRQEITNSTSFLFSYSFIPNFYVRHFYDDDWTYYYGFVPESFQPYDFSKDDYSFWVQQYLWNRNTRVRGYFSYSKYLYNEHYTEFDSDDYLYGIRVYQKITKKLSVNLGYKYSISDAKGFDQPNETRQTSDDSDATNYEHIYIAGIEFKLPDVFSLDNDLSFTAQYQEQFFTTKHFLELDPLHSGRYDYNYRFYFNYNLDLFNNFSLTSFFTWMSRKSSTSAKTNRELVSDEKDYSQYQVGMKFNYKIKF